MVDTAAVGADDATANPAGAWWSGIDASWPAVTARVLAAGVDGGVLVQAVGAHGFDPRVVREAAAAAGDAFVAVAAAGGGGEGGGGEPEGPVPAGVAGLRLFSVPQPEQSWLDGPRGLGLVADCAAAGITPSVCCLPGELAALGRLADAFADTEIALDHVGFVDVIADSDAVAAMAAHDNIVVKLSSVAFDRASGPPSAVVDALLALFGSQRIAWGSDHPQVRDRSYGRLAGQARQATAHLRSADADAILGANTARLWF